MGMIKKTNKSIAKSVLLIVNLNFIIACAPIVSNITDNLARNLSDAVLNQEDPKIVRDGFPVHEIEAYHWKKNEDKLKKNKITKEEFLKNNKAPIFGTKFKNTKLANTLKLIGKKGSKGF